MNGAMELFIPPLTALALGARHAFEADHLAAVGAFAVRRPSPRAAFGFGLRWAMGHGAVIVVLGTLLLAAALRFPTAAEHWLERLVGLSLVLLGAWTIAGARTLHAHPHTHRDGRTHTHLHAHLIRADHEHSHAATAFGMLHGLAGTGPAIALLPLLRFDSALVGAGYLLAFALGTAAAMGVYALLAGLVAGRAAVRSQKVARGVVIAGGVATAIVGVFWMAAA